VPDFEPADPNFESRVRSSFDRQKVNRTIGARLVKVAPGEVHIELPFRHDLTQQHGYVHAGITTTVVDSACGYAALTLMPDPMEVLTIEYKVNFLSPARGERIVAIGKVVRPGRTVTVCMGEAWAYDRGGRKQVAAMQATMIAAGK
jgi:uncharacterized protein (TIGR00369 family)